MDTFLPAVDEGIDVAHFQVLGRDAHFQADIKIFSWVAQSQRELPLGGMARFDHWPGRHRRLHVGTLHERCTSMLSPLFGLNAPDRRIWSIEC